MILDGTKLVFLGGIYFKFILFKFSFVLYQVLLYLIFIHFSCMCFIVHVHL